MSKQVSRELGRSATQSELDHFFDYFEILPVKTDEMLDAVFRLRYQVYCLEHPFENPQQCYRGLERDIYDSRSVHCLIRHKRTGWDAATVRLVLPMDGSEFSLLPIEQHCGTSLANYGYRVSSQTRKTAAEISRFAVSREFRRRIGEQNVHHGITNKAVQQLDEGPMSNERRYLPYITLGLFRSIVQMSADQGIDNWFAVMEPMLLRLLKRFGIEFMRIGTDVEYHGKRVPVFNSVEEVLLGIQHLRPEVYHFITNGECYWHPPRSCVNHV
ncbi:MAG TPA: PEP-CTERM/exosortase system-associated acyltransferase [Gammaproteobacteria bacterium]|nr:PEP-CTERM/exosortase system-associated acyltransferase [Gammaproteobacteria bacterium]